MEEKNTDSNSTSTKPNNIHSFSIEKAAKAFLGGISIGTLLGSALVTLVGTPFGISVGASVGLVTTIIGIYNALDEATNQMSQKEQSE